MATFLYGCLALLALSIGAGIWRSFRALRCEDKQRTQDMNQGAKHLGMEATDIHQFNIDKGAQVGPGPFLSANPVFDNVSLRAHHYAKLRNPDEIHQRYNTKDSATKLVKGIALHNPVAIFMDGKADTMTNTNTQLLVDLLSSLNIAFKDVDVPADPEMHLGLPEKDGAPDLPYLYIGGRAIGGPETVLEMAQSGGLVDQFEKHGIAYDKTIAAGLVKKR